MSVSGILICIGIGIASNLSGNNGHAPDLNNLDIVKTEDGFLSFYSINHGSTTDSKTASFIYVAQHLNDGTLVRNTKLINWVDSAFNEFAVEKLASGGYLLGFDKHLVSYSSDFSTLVKRVSTDDLLPSSNLDLVDLQPLSDDLYLGYAYRSYDTNTSTYTNDLVTFVIDTNLEARSSLSTALGHFETWGNHLPFISERPTQDQFTVLSSPKNGDYYLEGSDGDVFLQQLNVQVPNNAPTGSISLAGNLVQGETVSAEIRLSDIDGVGNVSYS